MLYFSVNLKEFLIVSIIESSGVYLITNFLLECSKMRKLFSTFLFPVVFCIYGASSWVAVKLYAVVPAKDTFCNSVTDSISLWLKSILWNFQIFCEKDSRLSV